MSLTKTGWENGRRRHPGIACRIWGELAETVGADLQQGVRVYVEGRLVNRTWVDRENRKHHYTEVVAKDVRFLDSAPRPEARSGGELTKEYGADLQ